MHAPQQRSDLRRDLVQTAIDALGMRAVSRDGADLKEAWLVFVLSNDRGGSLLLRVAFIDTAKQPLKAAVILINDLAPGHDTLLFAGFSAGTVKQGQLLRLLHRQACTLDGHQVGSDTLQ